MDLKRSDFLRSIIPPGRIKPAETIHAGFKGHRRSPFQKEGDTVSGGAQCPHPIAIALGMTGRSLVENNLYELIHQI
jgi:hypothetical protein